MFASLPPRARALVPAAALIVLLAVLLLGSHSRAPVIEAADALGLSMLFTGERQFRH